MNRMSKQNCTAVTPRCIRRISLSFALIVATLSGNAEASAGPATRYTVIREGGGMGIETRQLILIGRTGGVWTVERWRVDVRLGRRTQAHDWIDSRACAALRPVLEQAHALATNREDGRSNAGRVPPSDVAVTKLVAPPANRAPAHTIAEDYDGPVAAWWTQAERAVEQCWTTTPPVVDGRSVPSQLGDEHRSARFKPS